MGPNSFLFTAAQIIAVALGIGEFEEVGRDRAFVVFLKLRADIVARWSELSLVAVFQETLHAFAVGPQNFAVVAFDKWIESEPPNVVDGVFDA